jgi:hypothetical protein
MQGYIPLEEPIMNKTAFKIADPIVNEIAKVANELLDSPETEELRSLLTKLNKTIGSRYLVSFHLNVTVFDVENKCPFPLLQTGLAGAGFDRDKPF